jgi:hypothetical protein
MSQLPEQPGLAFNVLLEVDGEKYLLKRFPFASFTDPSIGVAALESTRFQQAVQATCLAVEQQKPMPRHVVRVANELDLRA